MTNEPVHMVDGCDLIELPRIHDDRGNLTFVESERHVPFDVQRVYYLYDVPGGESRAGHAHRDLQQLVIAVNGSFDVLVDDGETRRVVQLNRGHQGLLMKNTVWREIHNFSSGAVCLVLASMPYTESDYIRDYAEFLAYVGSQRGAVSEVLRNDSGQYTLW